MRNPNGSFRSGPVCGFTFDGEQCRLSGSHFCEPRAARVEAFFTELLCHTKGRWARQPFILSDWQRDSIIRPMFGPQVWDEEFDCYRRQCRLAWIEVARKNGKSELLAGIALFLLCADDEEGAEIYGAAGTRHQARKVFDVAARMVQLSNTLNRRLEIKPSAKRIVDPRTASYYEAVSADADTNLGHNPHGVIFDEVLVQPNSDLWDALRTGTGARAQPLMVAATTAGNDPSSFAYAQSQEMRKVAEDPDRAPHVLPFICSVPADADPWDESCWKLANPALGEFLSIGSLRDEMVEVRNDPARENAFRQFRLNQWVQQTTRWMPMDLWDGAAGMVVEEQLEGRRCFGGLDLAAVSDLTSLCWWFPGDDDGPGQMVWRHFVPEAAVSTLNETTAGQFSVWVREGAVTVTEGEVLDLKAVTDRIRLDAERFNVVALGCDRWNSLAVTNWLEEHMPDVLTLLIGQGFAGMSAPMKELMRLVRAGRLEHGGNPVARWCFDAVEVKQDSAENLKPVKPQRNSSTRRVDAVTSAVMAIASWQSHAAGRPEPSIVSLNEIGAS